MNLPTSLFAPPQVTLERRADGTTLLSNPVALAGHVARIGQWLVHWAERAPQRVFMQERTASGDWHTVTYAQALAKVQAIATWLLSQRLGPQQPVAILSENSVEHGLIALACMHVAVPVATISPAFSLMSKDFAKLRAVVQLLKPGVIYCSDADSYAAALAAIEPHHDAVVVCARGVNSDLQRSSALYARTESDEVDKAFARVGPQSIARLLFTSGSTGEPKGVINTHGMLTSNQAARLQNWPLLAQTAPVVVDWLPWSHTFGANHNFNMVLANGGTMVIDAGKPMPGAFETTIRNLREVAPTAYFNVPRGYDMLIAALKADEALRENFFSRLQLLFYAAAALPQTSWEALDALSMQTLHRRVPMLSAWGSTETAPLAVDCHFQAARSGVIGLPVPGVELKLVPSGDKQEIRVRGANVMPGYWQRPDLTVQAFDEEGFYKIGDAVRFVDPDAPQRGLLFDGRVAEDFKLSSGTWVNVGMLRIRAIEAFAPVAQDIVVAGHDGDAVKFLVFPNFAACRKICGLTDEASVEQVLAHATVRSIVATGLRSLHQASAGASSGHAVAALLMQEPASIDAGEITDKGYINQRAVLARRAEMLKVLSSNDPAVIELSR
jgi:feruloyl-CoA synthase